MMLFSGRPLISAGPGPPFPRVENEILAGPRRRDIRDARLHPSKTVRADVHIRRPGERSCVERGVRGTGSSAPASAADPDVSVSGTRDACRQ